MGKSDSDAARTEARAVLDASPLFLDTETTGLGPEAEIIEVGIIDDQGGIVFESLIRPQAPIPEAASKIHGITNEDVADAPTWADVHAQVCQLIEGRTVAIYNAGYDVRLLEQTAALYGLQVPEYRPFCAMLAYARYYGEWDDTRASWKWQRLTNAATQTGIEAPAQGEAHRAIYDCLLTLGVMRAMAGSPQEETTMDDIPTNDLIRDLAKFEDRITELKGMGLEDYAAEVDCDTPLNDPEADLMGFEGATLAIEQELQARGIDPSQAVAEYRAGTVVSA